jgi:hypothetical protein
VGSVALISARRLSDRAYRKLTQQNRLQSFGRFGFRGRPPSLATVVGQKQTLEVSDNNVCLIWVPDLAVGSQTRPHSPLETRTPWRVAARRLGGQAGMPQLPRAEQGKTGRRKQSSVLVLTLSFALSSMLPRRDSAGDHRA